MLRLAAGLERGSEHPLAAAIVSSAHEKQAEIPAVSGFHSFTGQGVAGNVAGAEVLLGNISLLREHHIDTAGLDAAAEAHRREGQTVVFVAVGGKPVGLIAVADPIKPSTAEAIDALHSDGVRIMMVTGDSQTTAEAVARQLRIDEVRAGVLPAQKREIVRDLQRQGYHVAVAGDGINDAPALAEATVGVAMGTGTDIAMESADITLLKGDLRGLVRARRLSRATMKNVRQNLFLAFVYNALGVPVAAGVLYPVLSLLISPIWASAAMTLSSVSVIANALRLRHVEL